MFRFPNPGSNLDVFVKTFVDCYNELVEQGEFDLDDLSLAMARTGNVTSSGAIGLEALRRSTIPDRSRDRMYNQSKMYAELYRVLGWIQSTSVKLRYTFTDLGTLVSMSSGGQGVVQECFIGLCVPSEGIETKGEQSLRPFSCLLSFMHDHGSISRDEMIIGPLSIRDDTNTDAVRSHFEEIMALSRNGAQAVLEKLTEVADNDGIQVNTARNYTRFPMAALQWTRWARMQDGRLLLTDYGKECAERVATYSDYRVTDFHRLDEDAKQWFIKASFVQQAARAGFDYFELKSQIQSEEQRLTKAGVSISNDLLFSPFQQLSRCTIQQYAPDLLIAPSSSDANTFPQHSSVIEDTNRNFFAVKDVVALPVSSSIVAADNSRYLTTMLEDHDFDWLSASIFMYNQSRSNAQADFYPLVVNLFKILGYDCKLTRSGQNNDRTDAIINIGGAIVPVEIKSPREEMELSVKSVRQALENKVIIMSRREGQTLDTTSLIVGYNLPNSRSDIYELIEDAFNVYGIRIGVVDILSLIKLAFISALGSNVMTIDGLETMKGVYRFQGAV